MVERSWKRGARWAAGALLGYLAWRALGERRANDLAGHVVLITGGSRGLGLALAREFARHGCDLVICARDPTELEKAKADLEGRGARVLAVTCDVTRQREVEELVERATARFGRVDVLVNNAGIIQVGPLESMTIEDFERAMAVNFWGTVYATLAVLPRMRERRAGRIVNITSIGGRVAIPHLTPYTCGKFAQRGFSEALRAELSGQGIAVTTIIPGLMRTGSPVNAYFKGQSAKEFIWFSIGDALPFTSTSVERAARRIVEAARRRESVVTLTWQAKVLGVFHDLFPGAATELFGLAARLLPGPDAAAAGGAAGEVRGMQLATPLSPSPLTALMNRAAREYNQYGGEPSPAPDHAARVGLGR